MTEQSTIPELSSDDWEQMPEAGKALIVSLLQRVAALEEQVKLNSQKIAECCGECAAAEKEPARLC